MLKKERWIIYPLLMLSLFSSLVGVQVIKAQQEVLDMVVTKELRVVNDKGEIVASLSQEDDQIKLVLDDGYSQIVLQTFPILGAGLSLTNVDKSTISLVTSSYASSLNLSYKEMTATMGVAEEDSRLEFAGPEQTWYVMLGGDQKDGSYLYLNNEKGNRRASLFQSASGHGGLWLYDKFGEESRGYTYY